MASNSFSNRLSQLFKSRSSNVNERQSHTALKNGIIRELASQSKRIPADLHLLIQLIDMKNSVVTGNSIPGEIPGSRWI
jgi:hypothetical protein